MGAVRNTEGTARLIRIDELLADHRVHSPVRNTKAGFAHFSVLHMGGLARDLAEDLEGYRYGTDFTYTSEYDRALDIALRYYQTDLTASTFGRGEHFSDDLAFWKGQLPEGLPRFFPMMVVGVAGQLAIAGAGELPTSQLDVESQAFIRTYFRPPHERPAIKGDLL